MKLRIGIDATGLRHVGEWSGIEMYTISMINALFDVDDSDELFVYCNDKVPDKICRESGNINYRVSKIYNRKVWQQVSLPFAARRDKIDLMFFPSNSVAIYLPCKSVATIHDIHPFVCPEPFSRLHSKKFHKNFIKSTINKNYYRFMLWVASKKNRVIAISEATKNDLVNVFQTSAEKIDVVYNGVEKDRFLSRTTGFDEQLFREKYHIQERYILCVGTHAYKNIAGSIKAFDRVRRKSNEPLKLVIAGSMRPLGDEVFKLVDDLEISEHVIFAGFIPDEDLVHFYSLAEIFLFPSFYEGFGLPVLEAFACEVPVVTSNTGSLPEVAGEAAVLVDPKNPEEIASAVMSVLNDEVLQKTMILQGMKQVDRFTWQESAINALAVFKKAYNQKK